MASVRLPSEGQPHWVLVLSFADVQVALSTPLALNYRYCCVMCLKRTLKGQCFRLNT